MAGFKGQAEYSIDDKGRVALPAKMRRALSPDAKDTFVATRGFEQCVFLYPLNQWEQMERELAALNMFRRDAREVVREMSRWADEVTLDGQGRISLPRTLIDFAELSVGNGGKAIIIGAFDHIELWDPSHFNSYTASQVDDYQTITERVLGGLDDS
ncbi:MAG: division/cell wall cluster transcriptional repressor MraZ [Rubricoccaceae bacterium]|nr:division/cell wall cluster transcriptional repressor MraZ [Rubricoccaceae bacterium]